jgi:hypothetical protein
MTPEAQQIVIAKACGWRKDKRGLGWLTPSGEYSELPDYLNDLNAMHTALKSQTQAFRAEFDRLLHALAEKKQLLVTELEAKDWADCFISCLQSQRDSGN